NIRKLYQFQGVDPETGLYEVADINEDGRYTVDDRVAIITMDRNYYGGFQNTLSYKGFRVDFLLEFVKQKGRGRVGNLIPGFSPNNGYGGNQPVHVLQRWQHIGDEINIQRYTQSSSNLLSYF